MLDRMMRILGCENIKNIKIQEKFKKHPPKYTKFIEKEIYWMVHGQFEQPIILNKDNYLIDGYTSYLIATKLGQKYVKVIRK